MSTQGQATERLVDVYELARQGGVRAGRLSVDELPRLRQSRSPEPAQGTPAVPLQYRFAGCIDERGRPGARLSLAGEIDLVCDRCGAALRWPLAAQARYYFVHSKDEMARLPIEDTEDEPLLGSARFDLVELIEDEAILALPMAPRHAACELALAGDSARADQTAADRPHPFAELAKLRSRHH